MLSPRIRRLSRALGAAGCLVALGLVLRIASRASSDGAGPVTVTLLVELPPGTPEGPIYAAGSHAALGDWRADGLRLERDGLTARASLTVPRGTLLEYKITRGSWSTVEKDSAFRERPNRRLFAAPGTGADSPAMVESITVEAWGDSAPPIAHTLTGDIRFHERFASRFLGNERTLRVYLPPGYDSATRRRYPVLYMHDGQNIFDAATSFIGVEWGVDEACEKLIAAGRIPPLIVVGIDNTTDRAGEYTAVAGTYRGEPNGGRGRLYNRFLLEEVKPFIDATYRTKPGRAHTVVMGSSLGGLVSLDLALQHPDHFAAAGVVSPALWWADHEILGRVESGAARLPAARRTRLWIDMGTAEGSSLETFKECIAEVRRLAGGLRAAGWRENRDFTLFEDEGADHSERAWNGRIERILAWLYAPAAARAASSRGQDGPEGTSAPPEPAAP